MAPRPHPFDSLLGLFSPVPVHHLYVEFLSEARRKDVEALVEANRIALEGLQALGRKQVEIFESAISKLITTSLPATTNSGAGPDSSARVQAAQKAWHEAIGGMRELAGLARRSQMEAVTTIAHRATQNLQDLRRLRTL